MKLFCILLLVLDLGLFLCHLPQISKATVERPLDNFEMFQDFDPLTEHCSLSADN